MIISTAEVANTIATGLRRAIPGLKTYIRDTVGGSSVRGVYKCPCGELSSMEKVVMPHQIRRLSFGLLQSYCAFVVEEMVEDMRNHVRSEGNKPDF